MRTTPATPAEVNTWLKTLLDHGHLQRAEAGLDGSWIVQRRHHNCPWTLHHPVLAMDFIEGILRDVRWHDAERNQ